MSRCSQGLDEEDITYVSDISKEIDSFVAPKKDWENAKKLAFLRSYCFVASTLHVTSSSSFHEIAEVHR